MKVIELKTLPLEPIRPEDKDKPGELVYRNELISILKIRASGMDFDAMEKSVRLIGTLRKANGSFVLEDADYEYLMGLFKEARWQVADPSLVQFVKDVRGARTIEASEENLKPADGNELQRAD